MMWIAKKVRNFFSEEDGVTAIEYGLIAALIAVVIILAVTAAGGAVRDVFQAVANAITAAL